MKKEIRIYVINCDHNFDFLKKMKVKDYDSIMSKAEEIGSVYSLNGFQEAMNIDNLSLINSYILIR